LAAAAVASLAAVAAAWRKHDSSAAAALSNVLPLPPKLLLSPRFPTRCHCQQSRAFGGYLGKCLFTYRGISYQEVKSKRVLNLFTAQLLGKYYLFRDFQRVQIYSIAHKNQKRITAGTQC
jgi:hypothetical protein